jgi:hypothetical protein
MTNLPPIGRLLGFFLILLFPPAMAAAVPWVGELRRPGDFPLVHEGQAAAIVTSPDDFKVVGLAVADLASDLERVTGSKPAVLSTTTALTGLTGPAVLVGTLGHSPLVDALVAAGKLDVTTLRGAWESFIITTVANPSPAVPQALVIVGSDRRGTAFGVYELSQAIGVSPWYWWADVTPAKKSALFVTAGLRRLGPPSVQYRGIFINDEDWGLQPWAAKTFEPETGDIGPKTYAKVCELLLRLKANTLWPGMHPSTRAFNHYPQNKLVADDHAIVMGSSHAEPMLRNNVGEWTAPKEDYNYIANRDGVRAYWEQRVQENGRFENIYTLGMRGIHDSNMVGPKTDTERIATLERIFADQRVLIAQHVNPHVDQVPQMFCAYKEVLALYRQGLKVPDDVTIVWPDDNFGYVRNFASAEERKRPGGFGVYYHISYLGAPLSYLWLSTTPPALIWEEMSKAYDHGARKIWIVNVGDIKPGEIGMEFFLQMAWDINRWRHDNVQDFLLEWAAREFGAEAGPEIARVMEAYYQLNFTRRPEHLQWWLRKEEPRPSPLGVDEIRMRLAAFAGLRTESERLSAIQPDHKRDAFEELVGYPVRGADLANRRYFHGELGEKDLALAADVELKEATRRFNEEVAGGKWRGMMSLEPADQQFQSMRVYPWQPPTFAPKPDLAEKSISIPAEQFTDRAGRGGASWQRIAGWGVTLLPTTARPAETATGGTDLPSVDYAVDFPSAGEYILTLHFLPTHPIVPGRELSIGITVDDLPFKTLTYAGKDGSAEWAQGVLNNEVTATTQLDVSAAGRHTLRVYGVDAGVVLRKFSFTRKER